MRRARDEGWRSRAVFKLMEIQRKDRLIGRGGVIVDLGAAPGGWSQYAAGLVGDSGRVVAVDLLEIDPLPGVDCIRGDCTSEEIIMEIQERLGSGRVELVMSDMAPNISGNRSVDQPRSMYLAEIALDTATRLLKPRGSMVVKLFAGQGFEEFVREARGRFGSVRIRKPAASRAGSRECYLVARGYGL